MKENAIIAVLVLLIIFIIFRRRSSGISESSGSSGSSVARTFPVKKTVGGPVEQMTHDEVDAWNADPSHATNGQMLQSEYIVESGQHGFETTAAAAAEVYNVYLSPTSTVTKTMAEITEWNNNPPNGEFLLRYFKDGTPVWGTDEMRNAAQVAIQAAADQAEQAMWAEYPASDKTLFQYLNNTMSQDLPMAIRAPPGNLFPMYAMLDQLNERSCLSNINSIITTMNIPYRKYNMTPDSTPISLNLVPYTSDGQIQTMFENAEGPTGEAGLSKTDKVILRMMTVFSVQLLVMVLSIHGTNPTLLEKYAPTSDGKCPWSDAIFAQTGENVKTNIINILNLAIKLNDNQGPGTATSMKPLTDTINALLPAGMEPMDPAQYMQTMQAVMMTPNVTSTPQIQSFIWFIKYVTAGPLYIWWLAKTKWKLSTDFVITA